MLKYLIFQMDLIILGVFGEDIKRNGFPLIEVAFAHNTISINCSSIREIHYFIKERYKYANMALNSTFRNVRSICITFTCYLF